MSKPMIRAQVRIYHDEDPVLHEILAPLSGIARTRRIRQLVRAGALAESGSGGMSHTYQGKMAVVPVKGPGKQSGSKSPELVVSPPSESESGGESHDEGNDQLPVEFLAMPTSMGSR